MEKILSHTETPLMLYTLAAVLLPLCAATINFCLPVKAKLTGWLSSLAIAISFGCSLFVFLQVWNADAVHVQKLWFAIGSTQVMAGIWLNNLSVLMLLLVNAIALPVHIYSIAYMHNDDRVARYFAYLSFFCFSMLALVVVDSLVLLYAFWELVGFSSYLLIGFWFTRDKAAEANKKAFIMNRVGDVGLLSAIIILFSLFKTFDMVALFGADGLVANAVINNGQWIAAGGTAIPEVWQYVLYVGLFLAVAAKSAQFPLHSWLPDAMEGPTSVSALIHAATMVAAGVFLLGRVYMVFLPEELDAFAMAGCFTAFMAATIALTQNDLKRILAYSTISQLGFMVMAMGIGAYASSLFHLVTHAFFKCLLFLVAGVVIHEMQHIKEQNQLKINPQNILYMGGLGKRLPITFFAAIIGALALIGFPFTSGYLSKDSILIKAFEWAEGREWYYKIVPIVALLTSWLTAFYVSRLIVKVFLGENKLKRVNPDIKIRVTDGGWMYKVPLIALALCSLYPLFSVLPFDYENTWVYEGFNKIGYLEPVEIYHTVIPVLVTLMSVIVMFSAYTIYIRSSSVASKGVLFKLSYTEWFANIDLIKIIPQGVVVLSRGLYAVDNKVFDGIVNMLGRIVKALSALSRWVDKYVVDGMISVLTSITQWLGHFVRLFQGGRVQYYIYSTIVVILFLFVLKLFI